MKKIFFVLAGIPALIISAASLQKFPQAEIGNGILHARLYLPDTSYGYYRGTRFDWSGVIPELEYKGHTYCGQWFSKYAPTINDAIMGPVEAFSPLGYEEAKPGSGFITIGVGILTKAAAVPYSPFKYYNLLDPGKWTVKRSPDRVDFIHKLDDEAYSYEYKKTVQLIKNKSELVLTHTLKNTGRRVIETDVYNHNLFVFDHQLTGPGLVAKFPFILSGKGEQRGIGDLAEIKADSILFLRKLTGTEQVYTLLDGFGNQAKDYDIRLENHTTGAGLRITCDQPLSKLAFWACPTTASPEPFIRIKISPGETFNWKISYEFYTCDILN
jgi:hypothetical protein